MLKKIILIIISFIAVYTLVITLDFNSESRSVIRDLRYTLEVRNSGSSLLTESELRSFTPVTNSSQLKILKIDATQQYVLEQDKLGNQSLVFKLNLPPYGLQIISTQIQVQMFFDNPKLNINPAEYLQSERFIESDDKQIKALAKSLTRDIIKHTIEANYNYVRSNIVSQEFVRDEKGALHALHTKKGDCTEMSFLLVALARAQGIPARVVAGFVIKESGKLKATDYHNWAEAYWDQRWHIIDAQKGVFDQDYHEYITFRRIAPSSEHQTNIGSQRFVTSTPEIELRFK